jgi:hypothetical protein
VSRPRASTRKLDESEGAAAGSALSPVPSRWTHGGTRVWPIRAPHGGRGARAQDAVDLGLTCTEKIHLRDDAAAAVERALHCKTPNLQITAPPGHPVGRPRTYAYQSNHRTDFSLLYSFFKKFLRISLLIWTLYLFSPLASKSFSFSFSGKEQSTFFWRATNSRVLSC